MATHKKIRSIGLRLSRITVILCLVASPAIGFVREARAETHWVAPPLLAIDQTTSTLEPLQAISIDASPQSPWFYQGVVQLAYAGIIAWIIALLLKSGK
jgi:hypothetical protein